MRARAGEPRHGHGEVGTLQDVPCALGLVALQLHVRESGDGCGAIPRVPARGIGAHRLQRGRGGGKPAAGEV